MKKIRGHRRRQRLIEEWISTHKSADLSALDENDYFYAKIPLSPWNNLSSRSSNLSEIKGLSKKMIMSGLFQIYFSWREQLNARAEPYYLKIWVYEPRFSKSQVVCAVGDRIQYYEQLFLKSEDGLIFNSSKDGTNHLRMTKLNWEPAYDEEHFDRSIIGSVEMYNSVGDYMNASNQFDQMVKKAHRMSSKTQDGEKVEVYSIRKGVVWIGGT